MLRKSTHTVISELFNIAFKKSKQHYLNISYDVLLLICMNMFSVFVE